MVKRKNNQSFGFTSITSPHILRALAY